MNIKKSLLVVGAVASVGLAGATGLGAASAATASPSLTDSTSSIVDKLATKFNLNKDDVEAVFEEQRAEHEAEMQKTAEERLTQAVADGKLTEDQKTKILAKLAEIRTQMEANHEAMKDKTPEERRELKDQMHKIDDLKTWAEENDIPLEYLMPLKVGGHGIGMGGIQKHADDGNMHLKTKAE